MAKESKIVMQISKSVTKKGKLKGHNKKETKVLRAMCPHHKLNKHGKLKATIWVNDGEYCVCTLCNKKFPGNFYEENEISKIVNEMEELNNQNKFSAVATNAGEDAIRFFAESGVMLSKYKKMSKKTKNLAAKQNSMKNKKKNGRNYGGSSMYGSWGSNNRR